MDGSPITPKSDKAKLFASGGSQAVRLPKAYRFEGQEVAIRREGERVILEPLKSSPVLPKTEEEWEAFWVALDAISDEPFPDPPPQTITPIKMW